MKKYLPFLLMAVVFQCVAIGLYSREPFPARLSGVLGFFRIAGPR